MQNTKNTLLIDRHTKTKGKDKSIWHSAFCRLMVFGILLGIMLCGCTESTADEIQKPDATEEEVVTLETVPPFFGVPYIEINGNIPYFTEDEITTEAFEIYSDLDEFGRCGIAFANVCSELMPTEERGNIGMIKPSGWHTTRYDDLISDKYLYNRCHLIAFALTGENANEKNLITGTRYMNVSGMRHFEDNVASYVDLTDNHVLYRVTPVFNEENLVADGLLMEGYSVEDCGEGICFCVYIYNVQPGITIDYDTGDSWPTESSEANQAYQYSDSIEEYEIIEDSQSTEVSERSERNTGDLNNVESVEGLLIASEPVFEEQYIGNIKSKVFHRPTCPNLPKGQNRTVISTKEEALSEGFKPCGNCNP